MDGKKAPKPLLIRYAHTLPIYTYIIDNIEKISYSLLFCPVGYLFFSFPVCFSACCLLLGFCRRAEPFFYIHSVGRSVHCYSFGRSVAVGQTSCAAFSRRIDDCCFCERFCPVLPLSRFCPVLPRPQPQQPQPLSLSLSLLKSENVSLFATYSRLRARTARGLSRLISLANHHIFFFFSFLPADFLASFWRVK